MSGLVTTGTVNIEGTGGIIEGNLDDANVNVNLDPVYGNFNGSTSSINAGKPTMFNDIFNGAGTISAWVHPKGLGGGSSGRIFDKSKWVLHLYTESNNVAKLRFFINEGDGVWTTTNNVLPFNAWSHVAVVYDGSSTSNNPVIYIDGVSVAVTEDDAPSATIATEATSDLFIGNRSGADRGFNGYIMDAKIYKAAGLSLTQIPIAAAKINQEPTLISTATPKGWYKFNASTTADSSGNSNTAVNVGDNMGSPVYDAFSVDVYDNSTTTDGAFEISQGKVEGLSLTHLVYDAGTDRVNVGDSNSIITSTNVTYAGWFKVDSGYTSTVYLIANQKGAGSTNMSLAVNRDGSGNNAGYIDGFVWNGSSHIHTVFNAGINDGKWHHIVYTTTGSSQVLYLDGVQVATGSGAFSNAASTDDMTIGAFNAASPSDSLDGAIAEVRVYDYALSAKQAASLYSNTYAPSPKYGWKFTAGTGNQSGFGTAQTGGANDGQTSGVAWTSGTLNLDGNFTIGTKGFFSAPRGGAGFEFGGGTWENNSDDVTNSYIHNNGTLKFNGGSQILRGGNSANGTVFFNLEAQNSGHVDSFEKYTVVNKLQTKAGQTWYQNSGTDIVIGAVGTNGELEVNGVWHFSSGTATSTITGGNTNAGGAALIDWNDDSMNNGGVKIVELNNVNVDGTFTTGGSSDITFKLTGDCEFDAVTVSSGDELDLNGQRMECSGLLNNQGTMDVDGGLIFAADLNLDADYTNESGLNAVVMTGATNFDFGDGELTSGTFMINSSGTATMGGVAQGGNLLVGSGTLDMNNTSNVFGNVTIATGATMTAGSGTTTVAGDFTTSGGLIGHSALNANDTHAAYGTATSYATSNIQSITMSGWIKMNSDFGSQDSFQSIMRQNDNLLMIRSNGAVYVGVELSKADNVSFSYPGVQSASGLVTAGKWHHVAMTWKASEGLKAYLDGKLVAHLNDATTGGDFTHLRRRDGTTATVGGRNGTPIVSPLAGIVGQTARWQNTDTSAAKSVAQIRTEMFQKASELSSTTGLYLWFQFDKGTGTTAEDLSPNGTDFTIGTLAKSAEASWAGGGTFTRGSSTLKMTGTNKNITYSGDIGLNNVTIATGGDSNAINLNDIDGNNSGIIVYDTLEQESGKLASTSNEYVQLGQTFGNLKVASGKGAIAFADVNLFYVFQNGASGSKNLPHEDSAEKDVTISKLYINSVSTIEVKATGNLSLRYHLLVGAGNTFNANGFTMSGRTLDVNGGTINLVNSTWDFTREANYGIDLTDASTLLTGNTTLNGHPTHSNKTIAYLPSLGGFELVGDISRFKIKSGGDLTVIGSVIDCELEDSTANIRQWHHTLDTQQLLDADEGGDDDLRLTKPALDNALELMTK